MYPQEGDWQAFNEDEPEVLLFPIRNEQGFVVDSPENYAHMIATIINATVELQQEFPDNPIMVVFEI